MARSRTLMRRAYTLPIISGGGAPAIVVTGDTDFGSTPVGTSVGEVQTVSNVDGTADLEITSISVPTGFSHNAVLPWTIPAGDSDTFTITLTATAVNHLPYAGNVSIESNASPSPYTYAVTGEVTFKTASLLEGYWIRLGANLEKDDGAGGYATAADGEAIKRLKSLVNASRWLEEATLGNRPVIHAADSGMNNRPVIEFDGISDRLYKLTGYPEIIARDGLPAFTQYIGFRTVGLPTTTGMNLAVELDSVGTAAFYRILINTTAAGRLQVASRSHASISSNASSGAVNSNNDARHLLKIQRSGNVMSAYLDGNPVAIATVTTDLSAQSYDEVQTFLFGCFYFIGTFQNFFQGNLAFHYSYDGIANNDADFLNYLGL